MTAAKPLTRRGILGRLLLGVAFAPIATASSRQARSADGGSTALVSVDAPEAKAVNYVENAAQVKNRVPDSSCGNCGLYQGASGSAQGPCQLFPGKAVKAAGWCSSWAPQM